MLIRPRAPLLFTGFILTVDGSPIPVHVKFIAHREYGVQAHHLLTRHELEGKPMPFAPAFTYRDMLPGMQMVIMETLEGDTLEHLLASGATVSEEELKDVHTAVHLLHQHGFVHGNIRPSNVIIQRPAAGDLNGTTRAYLIDFDLAGKAGEALYPGRLNKHLRWPRPTSALVSRPITRHHDLFMLKHLLSPVFGKPREGAPGATSDDLEMEAGIDKAEPEDAAAEEAVAHDDFASGQDAIWSKLGILKLKDRSNAINFFGWEDRKPVSSGPNFDTHWVHPVDELRFLSITMAHNLLMFDRALSERRKEGNTSNDPGGPEKRRRANKDRGDENDAMVQ